MLVTSVRAFPASYKAIEDSLRAELERAQSPADSLPILGNLYDLLPRSESTRLGKLLYQTACRAQDPVTAFDILRNQANRYMSDDSMLNVLKTRALEWPSSEDREETLTFIRMMDNMRRGKYGDSEDRSDFLASLLEEMSSDASRYCMACACCSPRVQTRSCLVYIWTLSEL